MNAVASAVNPSAATDATRERNTEIAKTILGQIKTLDRFAMMAWAATRYMVLENGVELQCQGDALTRGKRIEIKLNGSDMYEIRVYKVGRAPSFKVTEYGTAVDVYADLLIETIDELIGGRK